MDADAEGEKESLGEDKGIEKTELAKGQSQTEVNELKVDEAIELKKRESNSGVHGRDVLQQQTQGAVPCWEILHVRSIRVLLVENDDSTRHVVMALLRNCNYEVLEAAHALQAWKILEDLSNHIDIVLTEVEMPGVSGVGLLLKIMSHKTRKNIPVIMMSSRDSMGLVFKCLSKGAVDFLVKPIRKNELKNLWQHVWRRCHSSSGSGSESGTQTQRSVKTKGSDKSGNASDGGENDGSNGLNIEDESDDGSGAQSSWTKQAVEVDSPQALSPMDQVADCQDSTCGQVIRSNAEHSDKKKVHVSVEPEGHVQKQPDTFEKGKDLETIFHSSLEPKSENFVESQHDHTDRECEPTRKVVSKLDINNNAADDSKEPNCELSLKRARGDQDSGKSVQDDRFVLRRSEQSAFSRYNSPTNLLKAPNGITGSSSIHDNSIDAARRESIGDPILWKNSTGVSNNIDMGSTTNKLPKDKSEASENNRIHPSAFRPVKNDLKYSQQEVSPLPNGIQSTSLLPIRGSHQIQQHHHQNYQHHPHNHNHNHNHFHRENQPSSNHESSSLEKLAADASHCGSSNVLGGPIDGNSGNSSLNRSASGSNHGFSGQNGSNTAINNNPGNNAESDGGQVGKGRSGGASGSGSGIGSGNRGDGNRLALREAALIKFRQKRKDRCFKKRVRYQNRQKIAEQRPRVKGQFVKQAGADDSSRNEDE